MNLQTFPGLAAYGKSVCAVPISLWQVIGLKHLQSKLLLRGTSIRSLAKIIARQLKGVGSTRSPTFVGRR